MTKQADAISQNPPEHYDRRHSYCEEYTNPRGKFKDPGRLKANACRTQEPKNNAQHDAIRNQGINKLPPVWSPAMAANTLQHYVEGVWQLGVGEQYCQSGCSQKKPCE